MRGSVFLGPLLLSWCKQCNLPILDKGKCGRCGGRTSRVNISPPGDPRPAFEGDLRLIRKTVDSTYGAGVGKKLLPDNKVILLNKVSALERSEELIVDGKIIGNFYFNPFKIKWEISLKLEGGRRVSFFGGKKWIIVDKGAEKYIIKGANVLAPGVVDYDDSIKEDDSVIILNENREVIGVGRAKANGAKIGEMKKGMVVKTKESGAPQSPEILDGGQSWQDVLEANKDVLQRRVKEAEKFIKYAATKYNLPVAVAFSGGKDSLCVLLLALEALDGKFEVMFIDTGIEFPETVKYVKDVVKLLGISHKFHYLKAKSSFWEDIESFGPPARDYRFCCKTLKLSTVTEFISEHFSGKILNLIGERRYESFQRSASARIWVNEYIPNQVNAAPIKNWTSLHVWLYILSKGVPVNPLYYSGYERIGCIYCPASKLSEFEVMKEVHPDLYNKWISFLVEWGKKRGLPEEWATRGFWRWKILPSGRMKIAEQMGIKIEYSPQRSSQRVTVKTAKGVSPCRAIYSIEGRFSCNLDLKKVANSLSILGKNITVNDKVGVIRFSDDKVKGNIFAGGSFRFSGNASKQEIERVFNQVTKLIFKAVMCSGCGICTQRCPNNAIKIEGKYAWISVEKCSKCGVCIEKCPAINYGFSEITQITF
ncbi:MAG: phosphoadenosine phosphosulfate reductase domain-containing protein [Candidatus Odinarchaeia archaeon]